MKKWALLLFGVLISLPVCAENTLSNTLLKSLMHSDSISQKKPIIYVGKDFSFPQIAVADESIWKNHSRLVV